MTGDVLLFLGAAFASGVEMVEALTIVLALGTVRGWRKPLSRVPENAIKFAVGVMLTSFGTFWAAEGAGASWPGSDAALLALVALTLVSSWLSVASLRRRRERAAAAI